MAGASAAPGVCWVIGTTPAAGEGGRARIAGTSPCPELLGSWVLPPQQGRGEGGQNHRYFQAGKTTVVDQLPLLPSYLWPWVPLWLEGVMGIICCYSRFLEAAGSVTKDLSSETFCWSPNSAFSMCSNPLTFVYTDVWISLESWYIGQENLCGVMNVVLVLD